MRLLLLAIQIENIEFSAQLPFRTFHLKVYHPIKHKIYLYFKYLSENPVVTLSFFVIACFSTPSDIPYIVYILLYPFYQTHPLILYSIYMLASVLNQPLILPSIFLFRTLIFYDSYQFKLPESLKLVILCLMIPDFSTTLLILFPFILIADLSHTFNKSKQSIQRHKSYYTLAATLCKTKVLNPQINKMIQSYTLLIFLLSLTKLSLLPLLLSLFIYLLLYELDVLIQYHFFNQSQIYHDNVSRHSFYFLILNGISFLLVGQLFDLPHYPFILWYCLWSVIFIIRNFKKTLLLILPFLLSGCQATPILTHTVQSSTRNFIGEMIPQETQTIGIDRSQNLTLHVENHQQITKGDSLITYTLIESVNELKRMDYQIKQLEDDMSKLKNMPQSETVDEDAIKNEIDSLQREIELLKFDKGLISKTNTIRAQIDGIVFIQDDTIKIQSKKHCLTLTLDELEYREFIQNKSYQAYTLDDTLLVELGSFSLNSEGRDQYILTFDYFENNTYPHQSIIIKPISHKFIVPESFVYQTDQELYVWINHEKIIVEGEKVNNNYLITKGLKENDVLEALD